MTPHPIPEIEIMRAGELADAFPVSYVWIAVGLIFALFVAWSITERRLVKKKAMDSETISKFCNHNNLTGSTREALTGTSRKTVNE